MKILLALALFCLSTSCFSQKGDYLVKNNGDTIWGDVKLKKNVFYVTGTTDAEINAEDVNKIKSSNYNGNTVVVCSLDLYTDNLASVELDYIAKGKIDTVLILNEIYSTPKINLYFVRSDFKVPFYFYKTPTDRKPVQLIIHYSLHGGYTSYGNDPGKYSGDNGRLQLVENKAYVNQLRAIMGGCKKIPDTMWELLSYRDYSLKQLIKKYNKCK